MPSVRIYSLNRNPVDLVERDLVARAVIELGGARAFVRRHGLSVLQRASRLQIGRYPRSAERVTADPDGHAELGGAALDHPVCVDAVHRRGGERASAADGGAEEGALARVAEAGGLDVFIEEGFELVMRRHLVALAAFLMQTDPPAFAVGEIILDPHGDDGTDAGEGVGHDTDQGAVAQPDQC